MKKKKKMLKNVSLAGACLLATVSIQSFASEEAAFSTKVGGIREKCIIKWGGTKYEPSNYVVWVGSKVYAKDVSALEASEILKNLAVSRLCF
jgi:hypothetical protein